MSERDSYAPGTPNWIDLGTHDAEATAAFYAALFGWEAVPAGPPEETGGYGFFLKNGKMVAGYGPAQMDFVYWTTYICTADAEATVKLVADNGGTVLMPPMDVMGQGHMAVCFDPTGAPFSLWQPGLHNGCQLVNEPGTLCWNELLSRDLATAINFYGAVFGWEAQGGVDAPYTEWHLDGAPVGGAMVMPEMVDESVPSNWQIYFAVEDLEASIELAVANGASVHVPPMPAGDIGRFAMLQSPTTEIFNLMQFNNPPE